MFEDPGIENHIHEREAELPLAYPRIRVYPRGCFEQENKIVKISVQAESSLLRAMLYGSATKTSTFPNRPMRTTRSSLPFGRGINRSRGTQRGFSFLWQSA